MQNSRWSRSPVIITRNYTPQRTQRAQRRKEGTRPSLDPLCSLCTLWCSAGRSPETGAVRAAVKITISTDLVNRCSVRFIVLLPKSNGRKPLRAAAAMAPGEVDTWYFGNRLKTRGSGLGPREGRSTKDEVRNACFRPSVCSPFLFVLRCRLSAIGYRLSVVTPHSPLAGWPRAVARPGLPQTRTCSH